MISKRLVSEALVGARVDRAHGPPDSLSNHSGERPVNHKSTSAPDRGGTLNVASTGSSSRTEITDTGTLKGNSRDRAVCGSDLSSKGYGRVPADWNKAWTWERKESRCPPAYPLVADSRWRSGREPAHDTRNKGGEERDSGRDLALVDVGNVWIGPPFVSSHIPVPLLPRGLAGHADEEVMAATALTSLSNCPWSAAPGTAPCPWSAAPAAVSEPVVRVQKIGLSTSYSSSTSGNWSCDASDQSVPSTPSPPPSAAVSRACLLSCHGNENMEEFETTHFLFEDPSPRKRKVPVKVMFQCLWKNCGKVLSTSSGAQRHVRTVHLGHHGDWGYSEGEEDFYYSEVDVNVDTLADGLSSLAPTSPTTSCPPLSFPSASGQSHTQWPLVTTPLSQSAPSEFCHVCTDHEYPGVINVVGNGEKRQPVSVTKTQPSTPTTPTTTKSSTGTRKWRGEVRKCRKVYGMEKKDLWCMACRWKKACLRFTD